MFIDPTPLPSGAVRSSGRGHVVKLERTFRSSERRRVLRLSRAINIALTRNSRRWDQLIAQGKCLFLHGFEATFFEFLLVRLFADFYIGGAIFEQ